LEEKLGKPTKGCTSVVVAEAVTKNFKGLEN